MKTIIRILSLSLILVISSSFTDKASSQSDEYTQKEKELAELGLIDIKTLDESIAVYLVYSTPYNFMGKRLYSDLTHAFMLPRTAQMLVEAQKLLKKERLDLSLIVYDAARPISIQRDMWKVVEGTDMEDFVANPTNKPGMHNLGVAVDVTLMDCTGHPLPMGSEYDYFGDAARVDLEESLIASGKITQRELENRLLLRKVMTEAGFIIFKGEWWHFDCMPVPEARKSFQIIP